MKNKTLRSLVISAMLLAAALLLPLLTGQNKELGSILCLMHLPVLLCGILCGPVFGFAVGLTAAPLRYLIFGMPFMPMCLFMSAELAIYGVASGVLTRLLPKKPVSLFPTLLISMIMGRLAYGAVWWAVGTIGGKDFTVSAFLATSFVQSLPGIALQLVLIPILVAALIRAGVLGERKPNERP